MHYGIIPSIKDTFVILTMLYKNTATVNICFYYGQIFIFTNKKHPSKQANKDLEHYSTYYPTKRKLQQGHKHYDKVMVIMRTVDYKHLYPLPIKMLVSKCLSNFNSRHTFQVVIRLCPLQKGVTM